MTKRERTEERYRKNIEALPVCHDYIFSQNSACIRELLYGGKHVGYNGCGAVALHNVMTFIGKPQNFSDLLRDMENLRMPWLNGAFGTKPWSLGRYFRMKDIPYRKFHSPNEFKAALLTDPIGIVCTWNERFYGLHFYCIYYSAEERAYYTANFRSSSERFRQTSLDEVNSLRFVTGYTVTRSAFVPDKSLFQGSV